MRHALTLSLAAVASLFALQAQAVEQTRSVAPFTAVANTGAVNVRIEVGKAQSVVVEGDDERVADLETEVVGNELRLHQRGDHSWHQSDHGALHVKITMPQLTALAMSGAGNTTITNMSGDRLDVRFSGAGNLKADGVVKKLRLEVSGVGSMDTRELHADVADVSVAGVGSVRVWASTQLDASLGGIGSLTYYGDPKVVNTHGGGLGSISRGK